MLRPERFAQIGVRNSNHIIVYREQKKTIKTEKKSIFGSGYSTLTFCYLVWIKIPEMKIRTVIK